MILALLVVLTPALDLAADDGRGADGHCLLHANPVISSRAPATDRESAWQLLPPGPTSRLDPRSPLSVYIPPRRPLAG